MTSLLNIYYYLFFVVRKMGTLRKNSDPNLLSFFALFWGGYPGNTTKLRPSLGRILVSACSVHYSHCTLPRWIPWGQRGLSPFPSAENGHKIDIFLDIKGKLSSCSTEGLLYVNYLR